MARTYQSVVPLGSDAFVLQPARQFIYLLASAGSLDFAGLQRMGGDHHGFLQTRSGEPLRSYPQYVDFVVRAAVVKRLILDFPPPKIETELKPEQYLSQLGFQVRVYCGLKVRRIAPAAVRVIESDGHTRTYRVSFALKDVPIDDRIVFEVLTPEGNRLSKFYMGL